jgi:hypothetical protein
MDFLQFSQIDSFLIRKLTDKEDVIFNNSNPDDIGKYLFLASLNEIKYSGSFDKITDRFYHPCRKTSPFRAG